MLSKMIKGYNAATQISHLVGNLSGTSQEEKIQKANDIIKNHVGFAASAGLIPFPGADLAAVTAVQLNMLRQLANIYEVNFMKSIGKNIISAVVGSGVARIGASLIKAIPGVGTIIGEMGMASLSAASTYGLGKMFSNHFAKGGTLEDFDVKRSRKIYEEELKKSNEIVAETVKSEDNSDDIVSKLKKIAELKEAGVINEEEFLLMKSKLIAQY
ncbi:MAG: DUF697 domain-containing protein [Saprospiraceae bacterium]